MTSKELLEHIRNAPSFMGGDTRYEATTNSPDLYLEDIAQIERELEMLEIIKKYTYNDGWSNGYSTAYYEMNGRELKKVKEWIEK